MPVLGHESWETPVPPDLGFCCRKKDGVEGGNDGQLVKVFRQGGLCVLTLFYQRWRGPAISRGSGSSWKTGWACASPSVSVHRGSSQETPSEHHNHSLPSFPAAPAPMSVHVPSCPLGLWTQLPSAFLMASTRTFSYSPFPRCG